MKRNFSQLNKTVCILANSTQADLIGSKIMASLKDVSGVDDFDFFGYGGTHMAAEGMLDTTQFDVSNFFNKTFHTYRKTKLFNETMYFRYHGLNWLNKHYTRRTEDIFDLMMEKDLPKKIYQARPSVILTIDNEYVSQLLMEKLNPYYSRNVNPRPQRHHFTRFAKDFRQFTLNYFDFAHFTTPYVTGTQSGFVFPGEYCG